MAHIRPLDHDRNDAFISVEHIFEFAFYIEIEFGNSIDLQRIAADDIDYLIFLIPAHDVYISRCIERQIRDFCGDPCQCTALF